MIIADETYIDYYVYKSTKTRQRQFQKYGSNTMKFRIAKKYFNTFAITKSKFIK